MTSSDEQITIEGLTKAFGETVVLHHVDFCLRRGVVQGLIGANGAGKSVLIKHLAGYYVPTTCDALRIHGRDASWPIDARRDGIAVIHQEQGFVENLSVIENTLVQRLAASGFASRIRWSRARRDVREAFDRVGLDAVELDSPIAELSPGQRALVAVARALLEIDDRKGEQSASSKRLGKSGYDDVTFILDEPTASLGPADARAVLAQVKALAGLGAAILLVTHRLEELREVVSNAVVLRSGHVVYDGVMPEADAEIETLMFGERVSAPAPVPAAVGKANGSASSPDSPGGTRLRVLTSGGELLQPALELRSGEVVGVSGLRDAGHEELAYRIVGATHPAAEVEVEGGPARTLDPRSARSAGIVLVPGNREREALWMAGTVLENLVVARRSSRVPVSSSEERSWGQDAIDAALVVPPDLDRSVSTLSGGNQQKVSLARWFTPKATGPRGKAQNDVRILLVHEPTQGIDLHTRRQILAGLRRQAAEQNIAVAVFSSDYEALVEVTDRVVVFCDGRIQQELRQPFDGIAIESAAYSIGDPNVPVREDD